METFRLTVVGCGSASPTLRHFGSCQLLNIREKLFMIDCAEGMQVELRRWKCPFSKLDHIFITHLHGDHCLGLVGLISSLGLLGRRSPLHLWGPADMKTVFAPAIAFFCEHNNFPVVFHEVDTKKSTLIYEDRKVSIHSIPLYHRIDCCGYLFMEKPTLPHIRRDAINAFGIPVSQINNIKAGADHVMPDGLVIANHLLTFPAEKPRSFAYCSDTIHDPRVAADILNITGEENPLTLLYHEATFTTKDERTAIRTCHSTAAQAATTAIDCHARQLLIGHFSARYINENLLLDEARQIFPNTILSHEGLTIDL